MSIKTDPLQARAGRERRFSVSKPVRKGFMRYAATLTDRGDPYFDGMTFTSFTGWRAQMAAWAHAQRIVNREASFDSNGYSVV
ncbi:hypothetical protein JQ580_33590 [Bradyrhizobium japonicum]|uniref:hypothetical protein n=1 Tax=Bradyrhizobium japonicum TaxID=375 RepID=UPI001BAA532A|nr:hypothetical protein [Bradyrhizobium japonicum]MBR0995649.1 hypothetical protein [Bradyrhizobium japonicum]